jgi:hypothetical protein
MPRDPQRLDEEAARSELANASNHRIRGYIDKGERRNAPSERDAEPDGRTKTALVPH